jgi:protoporphyrinogen oxidase
MRISNNKPLLILGAGPAGLAAGFYARKARIPFEIVEEQESIGGNCRTLNFNNFYFDSGAHRLHDKYRRITADIAEILGEDLIKIHIPSAIYHQGDYYDFPLSPLNLLKNLGLLKFAKAGIEVMKGLFATRPDNNDLYTHALCKYGKTISEMFLYNYSEKLWGINSSRISAVVNKSRLNGLDLKTFLLESFFSKNEKTEHLDGSFYYPKKGIAAICQAMADTFAKDQIKTGNSVTGIKHKDRRIIKIEIKGRETRSVSNVISTLPLPYVMEMLDPRPDQKILDLTRKLKFRSLVLVALFLNVENITSTGCIYFPEPGFTFTRLFEPKRRSQFMSPVDKTSLVAEIPCNYNDQTWKTSDNNLIKSTTQQLTQISFITPEMVESGCVYRSRFAYPLMELGYKEIVDKLIAYLGQFSNLQIIGRNGLFDYSSIHQVVQQGRDCISDMYGGS